MTIPLKYNTGDQIVIFGGFKSSSDAVTDMTSLAISAGNIILQKANALSTVIHSLSGATHVVSGKYVVTMGTGDSDVYGPMEAWIDMAGALSERMLFLVMNANAYDALYAADGTGGIDSDLRKMGGVAQSATDLKDFADAGYDPATNKVEGVKTVDTTTNNSDMRGTDGANTTKTGYSLAATGLDAIVSTATGMVEIAKAIWDRVLTGATHNIATSAGRKLRQLTGIIYTDGTAQAGGSNTITLAAGESATDDIFWQSYIAIVGGTGAGQGHHVVSYNGTTKVATMDDDWIVQLDATSEYVIYGSGSHDEMMSGLAQAGANGSITLESTADTGDDLIRDCYIVILSGTGSHQARLVTAYNGTTKVATVYPDWVTNPDNTSSYWIIPQGQNNVWDQIISMVAHNIGQSAAKVLRQSGDLIQLDGAVSDASPTTTDFDTDLTQVDTYFADAIMIFSNGAANAGIGKAISTYVNASGHVTFEAAMAWPVTPVNGDDFVIVGLHSHPVSEIQAGLATEAKQDTAQTDLDTITGSDGVTLATAQGNYAPFKAGTMTESYAADGSTATPEQMFYMIWSLLNDFSISGTTYTSKKLDGSTTAMTFTLNDDTTPTSMNRAT